MNLSGDDIEYALYCVVETIDRRRRAGICVPPWMHQLGQRFNLASLTSEMSPSGHESCTDSEGLESDLHVGSKEAAHLLGLSTRQVRRLRSDLDGETVGGRMVFKRSTVIEYAQERRNGHCRSIPGPSPEPERR